MMSKERRRLLEYDPDAERAAYLERGSRPGLGDKIERVAQPIARAIDKIAGTKIAKCGACKKMKERLNVGMPFAEALKLRIKGS